MKEVVEISDKELVAQIQNGSEEAFNEIVERYSQKVHNLALRLTRNSEDAEEVIQDVFVTVFRKLGSFEGKSAFSSWLYRITVNTAFMKLRRRKNQAAFSLDEVNPSLRDKIVSESSSDVSGNDHFTRSELRKKLSDAIQKLPDEYRAIFVLRDVDGLSNQAVAEIMQITVPAVKSRLHRSRLMLRKKLNRYYDDYSKDHVLSLGTNKLAA